MYWNKMVGYCYKCKAKILNKHKTTLNNKDMYKCPNCEYINTKNQVIKKEIKNKCY